MDPKDNTNPNPNLTPDSPGDSASAGAATEPGMQTTADPINQQPAGAVDLNKVPVTDSSTEADKPSSLADNPNITIDSTDEPPKEFHEPKKLDVKPSEPLPGSIGSVKSGASIDAVVQPDVVPMDSAPEASKDTKSDDSASSTIDNKVGATNPAEEKKTIADDLVLEAAETPAVDMQPAPVAPKKKSQHTGAILAAVLIVLLAVACAVLTIMLIDSNNRQSSQTTTQPTTSRTSVSQLTCTADVTAKQAESIQPPAAKVTNTRAFDYKDGSLDKMTDLTQYTFADTDTATNSVTNIKTLYTTAYTNAGLSSDPFETNISSDGAVVRASHIVKPENFTAKNVAIIGINVNGTTNTTNTTGTNNTSTTEIDTSSDNMKRLLETDGYVCAAAETTTTATK